MESRTLSMIKICILSFIAIVLVLILIVLLYKPTGFGFFSFGGRRESQLVYDEVYEEDINSLYVSAVSGYIEIKESNEEKVSVKIYGRDKDEIDVKVLDNKLSVVEDSRHFCIGFCINTEYRIIISVPRTHEYDIDIKTASGDVEVGDILTNNASIKTVSGDVTLKNFDNLRVESVSGDIMVSDVNVIEARTVSGEININSINGKCKLKTTSGDVDIERLNITRDSTINTVSGDINIGANNSYIKTSTISGEANIKNNDRYAKVETSISTTSGDIDVGD